MSKKIDSKRQKQKRKNSSRGRRGTTQKRSHLGPKEASSHVVVGRNPVAELVRRVPDRVVKVFVSAGSKKGRGAELIKAINEAGLALTEVEGHVLDGLSDTAAHQGFVAEVRPRKPLELSLFIQDSADNCSSAVLALDSIYDHHNIGAMFRAAECFSVDALLWSRNRGAGLSPVVSKVSVGASELVPYIEVGNLAQSLREFKDAGYWIVTADVNEQATALPSFEFPQKTVLVMGSEGKGLSRLVRDISDFAVYIPMCGQVDSLNVSQATALFCYGYRSQFPKGQVG